MPEKLSTRRYLILEAALIPTFIYLIFFAAKGSTFLDETLLTVNNVLITLLAASGIMFMVLDRSQHKPSGPETMLYLAAGLFLLFQTVAALQGLDPTRSLPEVWLYGVEMLLFLLVRGLVARRGWPGELLVKTLLIAGSVVSLLSWMDAATWYTGWLRIAPGEWIPAPSYRLPAPNMLAVLFILLLFPCLARLLATKSRLTRILLGLYALQGLGLLFLTSSRGGWLGTAAGLFTLALINLATLRRWGKIVVVWLNHRRWMWAVVILAGVAVLAAGGMLLYRQTLQPTHSTSITGARAGFWPPAWQAFTASPWLGTGPFTFSSIFLQAHSIPSELLFIYSHNIYLDVLHGSGILGMAAFLFLAFSLLRILLRQLKSSRAEPARLALVSGVLAAMAAFAMHGLFDSVHHTEPLIAMLAAVLLGAACGEPSAEHAKNAAESHPAPSARSRALPNVVLTAAVIGALALCGYGWLRLWQVQPIFRGVAAADREDWPTAVQDFTIAAERTPGMAAVWQQLGISLYHLPEIGESDLSPEGPLDSALNALERSVELDPYNGLYWYNLAAVQQRAGEPDAALTSAQQAAALGPNSEQYRLLLTHVYQTRGMAEEARAECIAALALNPAIETLPLLADTPACDGALQALESDAGQTEQVSLDELEAALQTNPDNPQAYLKLADALMNGNLPDQAREVLEQAHFAFYKQPQDYLDLLSLEARYEMSYGSQKKADELTQRVRKAYESWSTYGPGSMGLRLYANSAYRIPSMQRELILVE